MDILPSKYIRVTYFWPKSAKISFCVWRVSKKLKKILKKFWKNFEIFFHTVNSHYYIWIVPTSWVPQITLEGSRDQNLRAPPYKVGLKNWMRYWRLKRRHKFQNCLINFCGFKILIKSHAKMALPNLPNRHHLRVNILTRCRVRFVGIFVNKINVISVSSEFRCFIGSS